MASEETILQKHFSNLLNGFGKNHAKIYWALIHNESKSVTQLEKETQLGHNAIYPILTELLENHLIGHTNARPKFYYCKPTLNAVKDLLKQQKNDFNTEQTETFQGIKKLIQNATAQSGEEYLIKFTSGQTTITNYKTKEPLTYKYEIDEIKQKIDKIPVKTGQKNWRMAIR